MSLRTSFADAWLGPTVSLDVIYTEIRS